MKEIKFTKAVASGNDFIIIDNRGGRSLNWSSAAKKMCQRKTGIGADGLLLLEDSSNADVKMRIFNPDGSEVEMCGNGARCVALYYRIQHPASRIQVGIETGAGILQAEITSEGRIKVKMTDPVDLRVGLSINLNGKDYRVHHINTGVPHVVYFVEDIDKFNVKEIGRMVRYHRDFQPEGTNADFVEILDKGSIIIRTYERGVEDETLACGTGACASAIISSLIKSVLPPVDVRTRGGEALRVYFDKEEDVVKNLYLEGEAKLVFKGRELCSKVHL